MKIGGGLRYVTGPMGAGKSLYGTRRMLQYLMAGKYVISNVRLYDDFAERAAVHICRTRPNKRPIVVDKLKRYYIYETDLQEAIRYRVPGKGETRALMVWDEAHNDLNNRSYLKRGKKFETESGDGLLEWATQLRKLGFEGILLSQSHENTDAQLRRVCNYIVRLQNQRETTRVPFLNTRVMFMPPLFLAYWYMTNVPAGSKVTAVKVERYFLSWHKNLYDTMDLYHGVGDDDTVGNVIRLPQGGRDASKIPKEFDLRENPFDKGSYIPDPTPPGGTTPRPPGLGSANKEEKLRAARERAKIADNPGKSTAKSNGHGAGGETLRVRPPSPEAA